MAQYTKTLRNSYCKSRPRIRGITEGGLIMSYKIYKASSGYEVFKNGRKITTVRTYKDALEYVAKQKGV